MLIKNNSYFGIKYENDNLSLNFHNILNSNPAYVIAGSFSYFLPHDLWIKFSNLNCPKLILLPFKYDYQNKSALINQHYIIESLIKSGFSVLINSVNHSKFLLTDKNCFIGSNNLTSNGIIANIESSIFMDSTHTDYSNWHNDIIKLIKTEMSSYASAKNTKNKEALLKNLMNSLSNIKHKMSHEELSCSINQLKTICNALISVTDSYQHLGIHFKELIKQTKKPIKLIQSTLIPLTNDLYLNLTKQFEEKSTKYPEIWIKNSSTIIKQIQELSYSLNELCTHRSDLFDTYNDMWSNNQRIYREIKTSSANSNLINLNHFENFLDDYFISNH